MFLSTNLKLLRKRKGLTQDDLAAVFAVKRPTLNNYENQVAMPPIDMLIRLSDYFKISIDSLIRVDLTSLSQFQLRELEGGNDVFIRGGKLRVLASTVGPDNEENIELVPEKAKAGYLTGFSDPEYIESLPLFRLPFLDKSRKYRTFQINGDSMWPIPHGAWVTGEFVRDWNSLKDGDACIILTLDDGISFKVIHNRIKDDGLLHCISLNPLYQTYQLPVSDVREIWRFMHYISPDLPTERVEMDHLVRTLSEIRKDVGEIKEKMK
jgi:transcriptional regulator with XRE-family HTH domain